LIYINPYRTHYDLFVTFERITPDLTRHDRSQSLFNESRQKTIAANNSKAWLTPPVSDLLNFICEEHHEQPQFTMALSTSDPRSFNDSLRKQSG
jgi:hypothetical protein